MKIRKLTFALLSLALALTLVFGLSACGGGDTGCKHESVGEDGVCTECGERVENPDADTPEEIVLVRAGVPTFKFVTSISDSSVIKEIDDFIEKLNGKLNAKAKRVADTAATAQDVEIIIGSVSSRGDEYAIDEHYLGHNGYAVKAVGSKIVLYAGENSGYSKAIDWLEKEIFGITKSTKKLTDVAVDTSNTALFTEKVTEYDKSVTIKGNNLDDYVIAYDTEKSAQKSFVDELQSAYYRSFGAWCDAVSLSKLEKGTKAIILKTVDNDYTSDGFCAYVDGDGNFIIECMYPDKFVDSAKKVLINKIASTTRDLKIGEGEYARYDLRNIYYADFGARGNGSTDDFEAIKACHDYANKWGHTVNSDGKNAVYYIGEGNGDKSIIVKTDTNWHGCKFIFDDSEVVVKSKEMKTPIFSIEPDGKTHEYNKTTSPITSLTVGMKNVGWAPGYPALLYVMNDNVKQFIRYGANENDGAPQQELIIVDANGNVDESTPVQWNYDVVTSLTVYRVDDRHITLSGADDGEMAHVETVFNTAPSEYQYYWRNIYVTRSNTVVKNIKHSITGVGPQLDGNGNIIGHCAPYKGFTFAQYCSNVTFEGFEFQSHPNYRVVEGGKITDNNMGTYEMNANVANNVTWKRCTQSNFYNKDGSLNTKGLMGTNYCKNLNFDNVFVSTFDAHCGVYNATIKDSVCLRLNFIGKGTAKIINLTTYVDISQHAPFEMRADYGSTWEGDFDIDGLTLKYYKGSTYNIQLFRVIYYNHNFGYTTYMPQNIILKNVRTQAYDYTVDLSGNRRETALGVNEKAITIFSTGEFGTSDVNDGMDLTGNVATPGNDPNCQHAEIGERNKCTACGATMRINIYHPTKTITVINEDPEKPLLVKWMTSTSFKDTEITVDGEKIK